MMDPLLGITITVIAVAVTFDFVNGFHDASNSIATIVATRVLTPKQAVLYASFFKILALFIFGSAVAKTVGQGLINLSLVTPYVMLAGLLAAVIWGIVTWWWRIPSSSSHALLGGYAGASLSHAYHLSSHGLTSNPLNYYEWIPTISFVIVAPCIGFIVSYLFARILISFYGGASRIQNGSLFKGTQLISSAFLSLVHGGNDAQKTAGIMTGALVSGHFLKQFEVPFWVLLLSYGTMALGTFYGGWRIVHTLGFRLIRLKPWGGSCAEGAAALSLLCATLLGLPVSTTHVTTGSILGVGAARGIKAVRWGIATSIIQAWVLTIPLVAVWGALIETLIQSILKP